MRRGSSLKQTKFWRKVRDVDADNTTRLRTRMRGEPYCLSRLKFAAPSTG
ncbi:hypothetical protein J2776_004051 [Paraburkholderia caledonica]|uniref:Uncharacterized protein n=1 Tax=Paraburkholderia caledonica TaxID=134536 RepID=A0ABU1L2A6_9BURK|nr:hypothetical protein [Paraburkholderia caledonica]